MDRAGAIAEIGFRWRRAGWAGLALLAMLCWIGLGLGSSACSAVDGGCAIDLDCPGTQVCRSGVCLFPPCSGGCGPGEVCEGARCLPCASDDHCGLDCLDCSAQESDRVCVEGRCGCRSQADCLAQQLCYQAACTWCVPDCSLRCCGNDGCSDRCPDRCGELGQVCNPDTCRCELACQPTSCQALGRMCGNWDDGCGQSLDCGTCPDGQSCSALGQCLAPPGPHPGAGQACHCAGADCALPCPSEPGAADVCLVTNQPLPDDGVCSFACAGSGWDADCWFDFAGGCCLAFGPLAYCVDAGHCPGERQYLQTCGDQDGACGSGLVCVELVDGDPGFCLWACSYPGGDCADGGDCVGLQGGGGACLPPGDQDREQLCFPPLLGCRPGLICARLRLDRMGYCTPDCACISGQGCTPPAECILTDASGSCFCGRPCPSLDPAVDCPTDATWICRDEGSPGEPKPVCLPDAALPL